MIRSTTVFHNYGTLHALKLGHLELDSVIDKVKENKKKIVEIMQWMMEPINDKVKEKKLSQMYIDYLYGTNEKRNMVYFYEMRGVYVNKQI